MSNSNLTQSAINAFLRSDNKKISDGMVKGLRLVKKSKSVVWELRYKRPGTKKDTNIKIGEYPDISLKTAREIAREYKELLARDIDPADYKKQKEEEIRREKEKKTFKEVAYKFLELQKGKVSEKRFKANYMRAFEKYAIPFMGHKKVDEIMSNDLVKFIKWIPTHKLPKATRTQNKTYTAKEVFNYVKKCFDFACHNGMIKENPANKIDPSMLLPKENKEKMKAIIDEEKIKELYRKISAYEYESGRYLMQFQALTALRNTGLYRLKWEWIDWNKKLIIYPPNTYKGNKFAYTLPLTDTLIKILKYFQKINGKSAYVFRDENIKEESLSNRMRKYYQLLGIKEHSPHGWRSAFRSIARRKRAANTDTIELQLSHKIGSDVEVAYMRDDLIEERRELLIWWEKFLTS